MTQHHLFFNRFLPSFLQLSTAFTTKGNQRYKQTPSADTACHCSVLLRFLFIKNKLRMLPQRIPRISMSDCTYDAPIYI